MDVQISWDRARAAKRDSSSPTCLSGDWESLYHQDEFDAESLGEILISSPWGVGVLKMVNGALTSQSGHAIVGYDDLASDASRKELVIVKP